MTRRGALTVGIERKKVNWVLDADIADLCTSLDHGWLDRFSAHRIADERILRLVRNPVSRGHRGRGLDGQ